MNEKKYFLLSLLLSTGLALKADNRANPKRLRANRIEAETGVESALRLNDKENELLANNPDEAFAYVPSTTRAILSDMCEELMLSEDIVKHMQDYSIMHYGAIDEIVSKIVTDNSVTTKMPEESLENLSEYKKALDCGDALVVFDINKSGTRSAVNRFCNLSVKKKLKSQDLYTDNLYVKKGIKNQGTILTADGSRTAPAYSFCSDPNTGMYTNTPVDGKNWLMFSAGGEMILMIMPPTGTGVMASVTDPNTMTVLGVSQVNNGYTGAPAYSFSNSKDSGLYLTTGTTVPFTGTNKNAVAISVNGINTIQSAPNGLFLQPGTIPVSSAGQANLATLQIDTTTGIIYQAPIV